MEDIKAIKIYRLFGFSNGKYIVITRGETQDQAYDHACKVFERGQTIAFLNYLPINSKLEYDKTHKFNWLHKTPIYLIQIKQTKEKEREKPWENY